MARALIVGCGCRGRALGARLAAEGWSVRGTSRTVQGRAAVAEAGIEAAAAEPGRPGTVLDVVGDVAVVYWLMGTVRDRPEVIAALHGPRLERLMERLVDTPVRGFVYEAAGEVPRQQLDLGAEVVRAAGRTWRIPVEAIDMDPRDHRPWVDAMAAVPGRLLG